MCQGAQELPIDAFEVNGNCLWAQPAHGRRSDFACRHCRDLAPGEAKPSRQRTIQDWPLTGQKASKFEITTNQIQETTRLFDF